MLQLLKPYEQLQKSLTNSQHMIIITIFSSILASLHLRRPPFENCVILLMIEVLESGQDFLFIISQRFVIQMGNSVHSELQTQTNPLSPAPVDPRYDYLSHWKNPNGELFLAREIELPESVGFQNLKSRLQGRQGLSSDASCIYPLDQCYFEHMNSLCSQQERCILTCAKPRNNLQAILEERRLVGLPFSSEEINLILSNTSISLQSLFHLNESFCALRMNHIAIDKNVNLMDPLLIENDPFGYNSLGQYPAPEQFREQQIIPSKEQLMLTHLFSLGVIGLQLCHSHLNIKAIYERYHKYGSITNINMQSLNQHVSNVADAYLRAKIATLTSFNPQNRKIIYNFIEKQCISLQSKQNIVKKMQLSQPINQLGAPISPLIKNITPVRDGNGLKQTNPNHTISPINRHQHLQKPKIQQKLLQKPRVSINFVTKIHHNISNQQNVCPVPIKKSLNLNNPSKKQIQVRHQSNIKQNTLIEQQTPLRIKKKQNFSTIKQVSEYDECASTSRMNTFQDLTLNGKYDGELLDGKRHGKGTFYFIQGSIYEGSWINDQMHGYGKLFYPNGKLAYQGGWKFSEFSGIGKVYNDEPRISYEAFDFTDFNQLGEQWVYYEGHLEQDQRHGKGCLVLSNGQSLKGQFLWDKIHGIGQFSTISGSKIHGIWNQSILQRTIAE